MDTKAKALHGRDAGLKTRRINRGDQSLQSQQQYSQPSELIQDVQQIGRELQSLRTPERRVCVYGIPDSVPYSRGWR